MSKRLLPSDAELIELYEHQKKSCKEICRMYGLKSSSSANLGRMLKNLGITVRKDEGANHHNWKGGVAKKGDGYIGIWQPTHERADKQGYVYEHTLVYQSYYGVLPKQNEVIHHIDLDKHNNKIENLFLCDNKKHLELHRSIETLIKDLMQKGIVVFEDGAYKLSTSR